MEEVKFKYNTTLAKLYRMFYDVDDKEYMPTDTCDYRKKMIPVILLFPFYIISYIVVNWFVNLIAHYMFKIKFISYYNNEKLNNGYIHLALQLFFSAMSCAILFSKNASGTILDINIVNIFLIYFLSVFVWLVFVLTIVIIIISIIVLVLKISPFKHKQKIKKEKKIKEKSSIRVLYESYKDRYCKKIDWID